MRDALYDAIEDNIPTLAKYIIPNDLLCEGLLSRIEAGTGPQRVKVRVFSTDNRDDVLSRVGPKPQLVQLFFIISKKPDEVFDWFVKYIYESGNPDLAESIWNASDKEGSMEEILQQNSQGTAVGCQALAVTKSAVVPNSHMQPIRRITTVFPWQWNNLKFILGNDIPIVLFQKGTSEQNLEYGLLHHFSTYFDNEVVYSTTKYLNLVSKPRMVWFGMCSVPGDEVVCDKDISINVEGRDYIFYWMQNIPDWEGQTPQTIENHLRSEGLAGKSASEITKVLKKRFNGLWHCVISCGDDIHISGAGQIVLRIKEGKVTINVMKITNRISGKKLHSDFDASKFDSIVTGILKSNERMNGVCVKVKLALEKKYPLFSFVVVAYGPGYASDGTACYEMVNVYSGVEFFDVRIDWIMKSELNSPLPLSNTVFVDVKQQLDYVVTSTLSMSMKIKEHLMCKYGGSWRVFGGTGPFECAGYIKEWEVPAVSFILSPKFYDSDPDGHLPTGYCNVVRIGD